MTVRTLKQHSDYMHNRLRNELSSPSRAAFDRFTHGSLIQAAKGAQAIADLRRTEAATKARERRAQSKRQLQRGGVLYVHNARAMIDTRAQREAEEEDRLATVAATRAKRKAIKESQQAERAEQRAIARAERQLQKDAEQASKARQREIREAERAAKRAAKRATKRATGRAPAQLSSSLQEATTIQLANNDTNIDCSDIHTACSNDSDIASNDGYTACGSTYAASNNTTTNLDIPTQVEPSTTLFTSSVDPQLL